MPSPKNGTVTMGVASAVAEFAAGKVEFRNDPGGNVQVVIGKQSFETAKLVENAEAFISHIKKIKPVSAKGTYINKICLSATMSPGITVEY
jgi:large subunit ribosomal protein L1